MKKLYILAACALMATSASAAITFYQGETPVANGSSIVFNEMETEDYGDGTWRYLMDPDLSLVSDKSSSVLSVTANCISGQQIQLCAGGNCVMGKSVTKSNISVSKNVPLNLLFECQGDGVAEIPTNVVTEISALYADDASSEVKFTITMNSEEGSVKVLQGAQPVVFSGNTLFFNLDGAATISFYSADGRILNSRNISGKGSISLSELPKGMAIYTISGAARRSGKILVK